MGKPRVKLNMPGIRKTLTSDPVQSELTARGKRAARAAGAGFEAVARPYRFTSRVYVQSTDAASAKAEAEDKVLTKALDAAR